MYVLMIILALFSDGIASYDEKDPTIFVAVLVRNKAHSLPYFLTCLHDQDYPKSRIQIWVYSDHNEDESVEILETWSAGWGGAYRGVNVTRGAGGRYGGEGPTQWGGGRFRNVIRGREEGLSRARDTWADYLLMIDADVVLSSPLTLRSLISKNHVVVAPMLLSGDLYSNFWCGMTPEYYYLRTEDYEKILNRKEGHIGCHAVKMVHSAVLVSLRATDSDLLTYDPERIANYRGPHDDIIAFAVNAHTHGIPLMLCNDIDYGWLPIPSEETDGLEGERVLFTDTLLTAATHGVYVYPPQSLLVGQRELDTLGVDRVWVINLVRRTQRRKYMEYCLNLLRVRPTFFDAVDGKTLDLKAAGITLLPEYEDPYHHRPMKVGEVGCFLSHYYIWQQIAEQESGVFLILEDDIRFTNDFRNKFQRLLEDLQHHSWDFTYIGRKILSAAEPRLSEYLVAPGYSYWTLGYLVAPAGSRALLAPRPLSRLLPVDEYIPLQYGRHPNATLSSRFPERSLVALSSSPLLVHPTHYTGDPGYLSDTEDSPLADVAHNAHNEL